ncbi:UxaA family hydrolase [bacterium]|nr:UxaA family hydrolase [bacterium]
MNTFRGYPRKNGPAGIRNVVLVISGDLCCNPWSKAIAAPFDNCYALMHKHGVGNYAPDRVLFRRLLSGITTHPNVAGFVFVSSGNEDHTPAEILEAARRTGKPFHVVSVKTLKGGAALVRQGRKHADRLVRESLRAERVETGIDQLRIGLNCAGTDTASAQSSNLVCGAVTDRLSGAGATVVLSETPDLIGLESELFDRCESEPDRKKLREFVRYREARLTATGEKADDIEMVAFNVEGGLATLRQKAHVSILKAGTGTFSEIIGYGQAPSKSGLVFMDGPAMTDFVLTGFMGAGVHIMLNTCGEGPGNTMPFTVGADMPSPILPVVKITGSATYFRQRANRIDFDSSALLTGAEDKNHAADRLIRMIVDVASGKPTQTEKGQDYLLNIPMQFHQA